VSQSLGQFSNSSHRVSKGLASSGQRVTFAPTHRQHIQFQRCRRQTLKDVMVKLLCECFAKLPMQTTMQSHGEFYFMFNSRFGQPDPPRPCVPTYFPKLAQSSSFSPEGGKKPISNRSKLGGRAHLFARPCL
jgi:hypothetical protein